MLKKIHCDCCAFALDVITGGIVGAVAGFWVAVFCLVR
jgi:hypothetical protein